MTPLNIYLTGVGGQGIGLLSEVLTRAAMDAGYLTIGSDTHGLAQRGGTVVSHLRIFSGGHLCPRIPRGKADLVVALERLEAARALGEMLKHGGRLFYCDATYQPIAVRMGEGRYPRNEEIARAAAANDTAVVTVSVDRLPDPKVQNTALLGALVRHSAIDGVTADHVLSALGRVLPASLLEANRAVFLAELERKPVDSN